LREEDIAGSGFAITGYTVHRDLGGDAALARLREHLRKRGLKLLLDFVPNHSGLDHPWVEEHPEYYISGTELDLARAPKEPADKMLQQFYDRLLAVLQRRTVHDGDWRLLDCVPAWDGNGTSDSFLAFARQGQVRRDWC